jgi:hypothetical protein
MVSATMVFWNVGLTMVGATMVVLESGLTMVGATLVVLESGLRAWQFWKVDYCRCYVFYILFLYNTVICSSIQKPR